MSEPRDLMAALKASLVAALKERERPSPGGVFALGDDADPPLPSTSGKTVPCRGIPSRRTTRATALAARPVPNEEQR